ncbi:MAG: antibiotic biosynthesis monooxygenase [Pseudomonadota bacterium]
MTKPAFKVAALAAAIALGLTNAKAEEISTNEVALFLTIKTQPGERAALVALWDEHLKARAASNADHVSYVFALDMTDPDAVHITEVYSTQAAFEANSQAPWFSAYMAEVGPLLAGEPGFVMARPHWVK